MRDLLRKLLPAPAISATRSTLSAALRDTMGRAASWDGRRLRAALLRDFERYGAPGVYVSSLNPTGGYLRISKVGERRRAIILRYVESREANRIGTATGWVALWDNLDAESWAIDETRTADAIADMIADFTAAI